MGVVSDPGVAEHVRQPLRHQDPDLFYRAAQLQDAHVQAGLGPLNAVPVEGQLLLEDTERVKCLVAFYLRLLVFVCLFWVCYIMWLNNQVSSGSVGPAGSP